MAKDEDYAQLKLKSGEIRKVRVECLATIGVVGNSEHMNMDAGKAGRKRWKGFRPSTVRGVVMNPVDHPHGGGEVEHPVDAIQSLLGACQPRVTKHATTSPLTSTSYGGESNATIFEERSFRR